MPAAQQPQASETGEPLLTRRQALGLLGGAGAAVVLSGCRGRRGRGLLPRRGGRPRRTPATEQPDEG